ncbi:DUF1376 domain-containing protein [Burkholderia sp. Bp8991]|uniref:DUF1376 domain-containing protein n=1 Tax=Burkholderia sp. Bp8991 TaxID=2184553 RepID=UPI000F5B3A17|nr:DUF1376 domain-containing protein [Burkholderia sp. Bp8991]
MAANENSVLLPAPLTPRECDLSDFPFMPLEIARLRRSKTWRNAKRNPELAFPLINLWTAAWHEVPAGSLEDDDEVLADLAMCSPVKWKRLRDQVLAGWVKCNDGRLYHPTVCEKVRESWEAKLEHRARLSNLNVRKRRERTDRSMMFRELRKAGIILQWNVSTRELRNLFTQKFPDSADLSQRQYGDDHSEDPAMSRSGNGNGNEEGHSSVPPGTGAFASSSNLSAHGYIFQVVVPWLTLHGVEDRHARSLMGSAIKTLGAESARQLGQQCIDAAPNEPVAWLASRIPNGKGKQSRSTESDDTDYQAGVEDGGHIF